MNDVTVWGFSYPQTPCPPFPNKEGKGEKMHHIQSPGLQLQDREEEAPTIGYFLLPARRLTSAVGSLLFGWEPLTNTNIHAPARAQTGTNTLKQTHTGVAPINATPW